MKNIPQGTSLGKKIRFYRNKSDMTQAELAQQLNVSRQALSNWERDINEPDMNTLNRICLIFGIQMNDIAMGVLNMEDERYNENEKKKKAFNKYDMAIGLFYAAGLFIGLGIFFVTGLIMMTPMGWAISFFAGVSFFLVFGLIAHAIITLKRKDK